MKGKTALITGSAAGLGHAVAEGLARAGCNIVLHGIEAPESVQPVQAQLERTHGVSVAYVHADLAEAGAAERLVREVQGRHGGVDVLVNNAVTRHFCGVAEFPVEAWDRALAINLSAAFHTIRLSLPGMRERGWGRIFNMTSVYGARAVPNRIDYVTTKTALIGLTRAIAVETINQGITCNAICPGAVLTPTSEKRIDAVMEETGLDRVQATQHFLAGKQPIQRFVDPAHIADLLVFLCSPSGRDITGTVLPVEGGWLAS
ncbi:D-beta-hydroxybutyrate dehydrogenase (plasmid) [Variovorax sp. SRS16]|uniref:SDR family oxidoreductase n=1 Tax=Variovorax sp. SRS16 TaxID=282217 RepID=UPI0013198BE5|nr:SDR family oxidoreductase [Variovorax sp. SRS16]VTU45681.1 D-beta-hydroxybutyrate dehydrogenase [Variovorax sp. SRS16]